jgi:hypothetical protein
MATPLLRVNNEELNKHLKEWEWGLVDMIGRNREGFTIYFPINIPLVNLFLNCF